MKFEIAAHTVTTKHHKLTITRQMLIELLANSGVECPHNADISVDVPGGGDWSHCDLTIDEAPINIHYTTSEET